jgi:hypothetical protein
MMARRPRQAVTAIVATFWPALGRPAATVPLDYRVWRRGFSSSKGLGPGWASARTGVTRDVALMPQWRQNYLNNRPPTRSTAISAMGHEQPPAPSAKLEDRCSFAK